MIKNIQIELAILVLLIINIFLSYNVDVGLYNYFSNVSYGIGSIYLKEFFVGITELGDSLWFFLIFILIFLLSYICVKSNALSYKTYTFLKNFSVFSFAYLLLVGLATQILKHIIGRARPNHADFSESFNFKFFSTDSSFHSFPSGHSSTIVAIILIASLLIPSLRIFFYIFGFLIAFSRVVVGAHFVTDVIAGAVVSIILYKVFLSFIEKRYPKFSINNFKIRAPLRLTKLNIVFCIVAVFITVGFKFDIFFSGLFYYGDSQFLLQNYNIASIFFRKFLLPLLVLYIFVLPIFGVFIPVQKLFFGYRFLLKEVLFIWITGFVTLIVVVNILLKNMWDRTRPIDTLQFGGEGFFTPWYKFGESCVSNCSFVSGDSSVGFMLIVFYFITRKNIFIYLSFICGASIGFIRIIAGGHFLSDIIFSQIIVTTIIFSSFVIYKRLFNE